MQSLIQVILQILQVLHIAPLTWSQASRCKNWYRRCDIMCHDDHGITEIDSSVKLHAGHAELPQAQALWDTTPKIAISWRHEGQFSLQLHANLKPEARRCTLSMQNCSSLPSRSLRDCTARCSELVASPVKQTWVYCWRLLLYAPALPW